MFDVTAAFSDEELLKKSEAALVRGDHDSMRVLLAQLSSAASDTQQEARRKLLARIEIDRVQGVVISAAFLFFLSIAYKYVF